MKDYYAEFLQKKNSENTQGKAVSKVSKGENSEQKNTFDTFDTGNERQTAPKCLNCELFVELIENGQTWFCPMGCGSWRANLKPKKI